MKRKVIQLAGKTLVLSLPNRWVKQFGVKKGDELDLEEDGSTVIITTKQESEGVVELDLTDLPISLIHKSLLAAYKNGFNEFRLSYSLYSINLKTNKKISTFSAIQTMLSEMIGTEIIDNGNTFCTIKEISKPSESEFDNMLRRMFFLIRDLAASSLALVESGGSDSSDTTLKHRNIEKFGNYCLRLLNKKGHREYKKTSLYYSVISGLVEISDVYHFIVRGVVENNRKITKEGLTIFKGTNEAVNSFYDFFYKYNKDNFTKIVDERRALFSEINRWTKKAKSDDLVLLHRLAVVVNKLLNLAEVRVSVELL